MARGLAARRSRVLALSIIPVVAAMLLGGVGQAVAADRLVLGENFTATW